MVGGSQPRGCKKRDYQQKPPKIQRKLANALIILVIKWLGDFSVELEMDDPLIGLGMTKFHKFQFWRYGTLYRGKRGCSGFEKECHSFVGESS